MINISFVGNLNRSAEFASKWRKKLVPDQVQAGKYLSKVLGNKNLPVEGLRKASELKKQLKDQARQIRLDRKISSIRSENYQPKPTRYNLMIDGTEDDKLKRLRNASKKHKYTGRIRQAKKFLGKKKLGIGAVGLATMGTISYGIARKIRSDKGRKRK